MKRNTIIICVIGLACVVGLIFFLEQRKKNSLPNTPSSNNLFMRDATGKPGEIYVVTDSITWQDTAGVALKIALSQEQPCLPQPEPYFSLKQIEPSGFRGLTRFHKNIIFITSLSQNNPTTQIITKILGQETINNLKQNKDKSQFYIATDNVWAKNQKVIFLFSNNQLELANKIIAKQNDFLYLFTTLEKQRLAARLKMLKPNTDGQKILKKDFGLTISLPNDYQLNYHNNGIVWFVRSYAADKDLNLFFYEYKYTSPKQLEPKKILAKHDSLTKLYMPGPNKGSYKIIEKLAEPVSKIIDFKNHYAVEIRNIWTVENNFMAGPSVILAIVNEKKGTILIVEGFVYYPRENKRELLRELEALISTMEY